MENGFIIKKCEKNEIGKVRMFFGTEWDEKHVFSTSQKYVDWNFLSAKGDYNIIFAMDKENGDVLGILCFITNQHFDNNIKHSDKFVWITNWLVKKNCPNGLGIKLYMALLKIENTRNIGTVGNNELTTEMYKALRYKTGGLKQFFVVNKSVEQTIISNYTPKAFDTLEDDIFYLACINDLTEQKFLFSESFSDYLESMYPKKSIMYLNKKYFCNPFYDYFLYTVKDSDFLHGILVFRVVMHNNKKALRIVEYLGYPKWLSSIQNSLQKLLREFDAEYLDFYCAGISESDEYQMLHSGFEINDYSNGLIVPSYFEPFLNDTIKINYAYQTTKPDNTFVFKGDCDRDNPRIL